MTIRFPKGMRSLVEKYAPQIAKLAKKTVAEVTGEAPETQWDPTVDPLGAGSWGVVWPLTDVRFILKVTADPTEGPIVATIMAEPQLHEHMAIIHYFAVKKLPVGVTYRNKTFPLFVIIAERLQHSSQVKKPEWGSDGAREHDRFSKRLNQMKIAAGALVHEQRKKRPSEHKIDDLFGKWMESVQRLNDGPMEDFISQFYDHTRDPNESQNDGPTGGVLADIHYNNIGKRVVDWTTVGDGSLELSPSRPDQYGSSYWVISDPGHSSLIEKPEIAEIENPRNNPMARRGSKKHVAHNPQEDAGYYVSVGDDNSDIGPYTDKRQARLAQLLVQRDIGGFEQKLRRPSLYDEGEMTGAVEDSEGKRKVFSTVDEWLSAGNKPRNNDFFDYASKHGWTLDEVVGKYAEVFDGGGFMAVAEAVNPSEYLRTELARGDVVKIRNTKWAVYREVDNFTYWAYKWPSKKNKVYTMRRDPSTDEMSVFESGGSGQRLGDDIVAGPFAIVEHLEEGAW